MLWIALLRFPDGSQVESSLLDVVSSETGMAIRAYRLCDVDGVVQEFPTLSSVLRHLVQRYDPEDLDTAVGGLTTELAVATRVDARARRRACPPGQLG